MKKKKYNYGGPMGPTPGEEKMSSFQSAAGSIPVIGQYVNAGMSLQKGIMDMIHPPDPMGNSVLAASPGNYAYGGSVTPVNNKLYSRRSSKGKKKSNFDASALLSIVGALGAFGALASQNNKSSVAPSVDLSKFAPKIINPGMPISSTGDQYALNYQGDAINQQVRNTYNPDPTIQSAAYGGPLNGGPGVYAPADTITPQARALMPLYQNVTGFNPNDIELMNRLPIIDEKVRIQQQSLLYDGTIKSNKKMSKVPKYREMATGGDIPLADGMVQIKGNAQVTDGNPRMVAGSKVRLDHNEVIVQNEDGSSFVFSDAPIFKTKDGDTPASEAKVHARAKGKLEKKLARNPYDEQSLAAASHVDRLLTDLMQRQETTAHAMGLRNRQTNAYATGGPITPREGQPFIDLGDGYYYDPYGKQTVKKDSDGTYTAAKKPGFVQDTMFAAKVQQHLNKYPMTENTAHNPSIPKVSGDKTRPFMKIESVEPNSYYDPYASQFLVKDEQTGKYTKSPNPQGFTRKDGKLIDEQTGKIYDADAHMKQYPTDWDPFNWTGQGTVPESTNMVAPINPKKSSGNKAATPATNGKLPTTPITPIRTNTATGISIPGKDNYNSISRTPWGDVISETLPYPDDPGKVAPQIPYGKGSDLAIDNEYLKQAWNAPLKTTPSTLAPAANTKVATDARYKTPWTVGDMLKTAELAGKAIGAFGGPEVERPSLDNTNITQVTYDPRTALHQAQRNYQNYVNTAPASSINMRRALQASALGQLINNQGNILTQYRDMNNQGLVQYEGRTSDQKRYNNQMVEHTKDINAQNRGAYDAVQQNFFTSVGQYGEDLNRKKYASDAINLLSVQYPDVYARILKGIENGG